MLRVLGAGRLLADSGSPAFCPTSQRGGGEERAYCLPPALPCRLPPVLPATSLGLTCAFCAFNTIIAISPHNWVQNNATAPRNTACRLLLDGMHHHHCFCGTIYRTNISLTCTPLRHILPAVFSTLLPFVTPSLLYTRTTTRRFLCLLPIWAVYLPGYRFCTTLLSHSTGDTTPTAPPATPALYYTPLLYLPTHSYCTSLLLPTAFCHTRDFGYRSRHATHNTPAEHCSMVRLRS